MIQRETILGLLTDAYEAECHGIEVYTALAARVGAVQVKDLFNRMANDERKHAEIVLKIRNFGEQRGEWSEMGSIYHGFSEEDVLEFPQIDPFDDSEIVSINPNATLLESLEALYRIERRQHSVYTRLANMFDDLSVKNIFNVLANEERKHALNIAEHYQRCGG